MSRRPAGRGRRNRRRRPVLPAQVLGPIRCDRSEADELQRRLVRARARGEVPDTLVLAEHPAGFGLGWGTPVAREPGDEDLPWEDRGGGLALYGPGMLSAYLVLDLEQGHTGLYYLARRLGRALNRLLGEYYLRMDRVAGLPPACVGGRRLAAVGVGLDGAVTRFGLTVAVAPDLAALTAGLPPRLRFEEWTSLAAEGPPVEVRLDAVAKGLAIHLGTALSRRFRAVDRDALEGRLDAPRVPDGAAAVPRTPRREEPPPPDESSRERGAE